MTDANGWPGKPGVPLNPERDGWHWFSFAGIIQSPWFWAAKIGGWWRSNGKIDMPETVLPQFIYLGPCLTPTEHSAALAAQAVAMREAIAKHLETLGWSQMAATVAVFDSAIPFPDRSALAALLAAERAAGVREGMARMCDTLRDYIGTSGITHKSVLHSLFRAEAALRAAMKETP